MRRDSAALSRANIPVKARFVRRLARQQTSLRPESIVGRTSALPVIRGRSRNLRVNHRTSHQIRTRADLLLGPETCDADGNIERHDDTISVFNGPPPEIQTFRDQESEIAAFAGWLSARAQEGIPPHETALFVRSPAELDRAISATRKAELPYAVLDENIETQAGRISISTMHLAKGLEFRAVAVMACDDEIIPLQERIQSISEDSELEEVYNTEATCFTSPAPAPETISSSPAWNPPRSFWMICRGEDVRPVFRPRNAWHTRDGLLVFSPRRQSGSTPP